MSEPPDKAKMVAELRIDAARGPSISRPVRDFLRDVASYLRGDAATLVQAAAKAKVAQEEARVRQIDAEANEKNAAAFKTSMEAIEGSGMSETEKEVLRRSVTALFLGPRILEEAESIESELESLRRKGVRITLIGDGTTEGADGTTDPGNPDP